MFGTTVFVISRSLQENLYMVFCATLDDWYLTILNTTDTAEWAAVRHPAVHTVTVTFVST